MEIKEGCNSKCSVKEKKKKENELVTGLIPYLKIITKNINQLGNLTELCINCAVFTFL